MGVYGIVLAGWASGSTYPLLGGLRSAAQMVSYEIAMGLSIVAVFLYAGSMSTSEIVAAQADGNQLSFFGWEFTGPSWYAVLLPVSFVIYVIAVVGETNRAPFDLPEAESELVGGFHTEYSSLKFALFFLAEYVNMVTVSALAATLFLGGWRAPWPISIWDGANTGWWPLLWFFLKVVVALFVFIWLRGTLPRLRYDQFMRFGWKVLVPTALVWILVVATMRTVSREADLSTGEVALYVGVPVALLVLAGLLVASRSANRDTRLMAEEASAGAVHATDPEPEVLPPAGPRRRPTGAPSRAEGGFPDPADGPEGAAVPAAAAPAGGQRRRARRQHRTTRLRPRTARGERRCLTAHPPGGRAARSSARPARGSSSRRCATACCPPRPRASASPSRRSSAR